MGLFDIFTTDAQQNAANAQIQGLQNAAGAYGAANQLGINNLTGYTQTGLGQLGGLYGQGQGALTGYGGQAAGALTGNAGSALGALQGYGGQALGALTGAYGAGLAPYYQNYGQAQQGTNALGNALGLNGPAGNAAATTAFWNNPAIQSQLDIGSQNVLRNQAATGQLASGATNVDLQNLGQQIASQGWNQYINNLQPYLGYSQGAAQGIGNLQSGLGNQLAGIYGGLGSGSANLYTGLGQNLAGVYGGLGSGLNQSLMQQGNVTNATYGNLGSQLAQLYGNQANMAYGNQVGQGNAQANADLASLQASANLWGLGTGLLGLGAGTKGATSGTNTGTPGLLNQAGTSLYNLFSKAFARGGRPEVGKPALVGEEGPEIFIPDQRGTIMPNDWTRFRVNATQRGGEMQDAMGPPMRTPNQYVSEGFEDLRSPAYNGPHLGLGRSRIAGDVLPLPIGGADAGRPSPSEVGAGMERGLPRINPGNTRLPYTINPNIPGAYPRGRYSDLNPSYTDGMLRYVA